MTKKLTLNELLDLIELEDYRGIIDKQAFLQLVQEKGILPRVISDVRGAVRLTVDRNGKDFDVTQYPTELASETVNEIFSASGNSPANDNHYAEAA